MNHYKLGWLDAFQGYSFDSRYAYSDSYCLGYEDGFYDYNWYYHHK